MAIEREKESYTEETSKLLNSFSELHHGLRVVKSQLDAETNKVKEKNQSEYLELVREQKKKEDEFEKEIEGKKKLNESLKKNFLELDLIEEEKDSFL
jgi:hypothetical protein